MITARLTDGRWIIGIEERNVQLLKEGRPMIIRFSELDPNLPDMCVIYGPTMKDVEDMIQSQIGPDTVIIDKREKLQ